MNNTITRRAERVQLVELLLAKQGYERHSTCYWRRDTETHGLVEYSVGPRWLDWVRPGLQAEIRLDASLDELVATCLTFAGDCEWANADKRDLCHAALLALGFSCFDNRTPHESCTMYREYDTEWAELDSEGFTVEAGFTPWREFSVAGITDNLHAYDQEVTTP